MHTDLSCLSCRAWPVGSLHVHGWALVLDQICIELHALLLTAANGSSCLPRSRLGEELSLSNGHISMDCTALFLLVLIDMHTRLCTCACHAPHGTWLKLHIRVHASLV